MSRRFAFACALAAVVGGGCQQTLVLDDLSPDASPFGTGGTGGPSDGSVDGRCPGGQSQPITYSEDIAEVVVALDRSTAMSTPFGSSDQLHAAISTIESDVGLYGGQRGHAAIQFSFVDFPDTATTATDCNAANGCCSSDVTPSYMTFYDDSTCGDSANPPPSCVESMNRPTVEALNTAYDYFAAPGSSRGSDRYVLLVTDGDPENCPTANSACTDAENAVSALTSIGVTTWVVAIEPATNIISPCLNNLVMQQGVFPAPSMQVTGPVDLPVDIGDILQPMADNVCHLTLTYPPSSGRLKVLWDGAEQQADTGSTMNQWGWDGNTHVYLHGTLCQNFLQTYLQENPDTQFGLQIFDGACRFGQAP